jgi:hypothetical protein
MNMKKILFVDTNIFIHYHDFDQIDWPAISHADSVIIIIPPITIRELNKHKDGNQRQRIRKRAGLILRKISGIIDQNLHAQINPLIELVLEPRDPLIDFGSFQLSRDIQDDHLIASILTYHDENPEADIVLFTSDSGLSLWAKANSHNISTINLDESLRLPEEPDPEIVKIKNLEEELRQLKLKNPQLSLVFEDENQYATFTLPSPVVLTEENIENRIAKVKEKYPHMEIKPYELEIPEMSDKKSQELVNLAAKLRDSMLTGLSPEDYEKYNNDLDEYYTNYPQYLSLETNFENIKRRAIKLSILLSNDGTAPAEDIDVFIHFPDGFQLFHKEDLPKAPKPPQPPEKPKSQMEHLMGGLSVLGNVPYLPSTINPVLGPISSPPNISFPKIKRTGSYDVNIHVNHIKHQLLEPFDPLYVIFESYETAKSFNITYELLAANLPSRITGVLHIIIKKETSS